MTALEKIARCLTFFGMASTFVSCLWLWLVPMLLGLSLSSFSINVWAGVLMIATFFGLMLTGLRLWVSLENKKK
ncbi:MAG: hypothetical protein K6B71_03755 [Alphaproteobacteria bacterium]|nr:hypothetical protein [Alphaproteobacteria bacterium]